MENFRNIVCTKTPIPVFACSGTDPLALTAPILGLRRAGQPMATYSIPERRASAPALRQIPGSW